MTATPGSLMHAIARLAVLALCTSIIASPASAQARDVAAADTVGSAMESASSARAPRRSWTSDRREFAVGDVITVLVDEFTLAAARTDNNAVDRKRRDAGLGAGGQSQGKPLGDVSASFGTSNNAESRQRGDAMRENRFASELSVRVTAVDPSGLLQIKGRKLVNVDKNAQEVTLSGWVRPQDVGPYNTIASSRVGDAELVYSSKGNLGKPRGGILSRIVGALWP